MNLGKGSQLFQRRILLLSARLTETRGKKKHKKTEEQREPTVDVHFSGKQVGTPQLKFYSTVNSLASSKHLPILKQSDFT